MVFVLGVLSVVGLPLNTLRATDRTALDDLPAVLLCALIVLLGLGVTTASTLLLRDEVVLLAWRSADIGGDAAADDLGLLAAAW